MRRQHLDGNIRATRPTLTGCPEHQCEAEQLSPREQAQRRPRRPLLETQIERPTGQQTSGVGGDDPLRWTVGSGGNRLAMVTVFELGRCKIAEGGMAALAIVEDLDVLEDGGLCLLSGGPGLTVE